MECHLKHSSGFSEDLLWLIVIYIVDTQCSPISSQLCSNRVILGDWGGYAVTSISCSLSHSDTILAQWHGVLSSMKMKSNTRAAQADGIIPSSKTCRYWCAFIVMSTYKSIPVWSPQMQHHTIITLPIPCFTVPITRSLSKFSDPLLLIHVLSPSLFIMLNLDSSDHTTPFHISMVYYAWTLFSPLLSE